MFGVELKIKRLAILEWLCPIHADDSPSSMRAPSGVIV